jgi:hypothetical protein
MAPVWTAHVLEARPDLEHLTYLDADLLFFSSVEPLFEEMGAASIAAIEHRYTARLEHLLPRGRFCVQWLTFRHDDTGRQCLRRWRDQCLEWCYARVEDGRFADQKYLDAWPTEYGAAFRALEHVGAGLAPWNFPRFPVEERGGALSVAGRPLIFYHFHQFQLLVGGEYDWLSSTYQQDGAPPAAVYRAYERALSAAIDEVRLVDSTFTRGFRTAAAVGLRRVAQRVLPLPVKNALRRLGITTW